MTHTFNKWIGLASLSFLLGACGGESSSSTDTTQETSASVSMQYDVSGMLKQTIEPLASASAARVKYLNRVLKA